MLLFRALQGKKAFKEVPRIEYLEKAKTVLSCQFLGIFLMIILTTGEQRNQELDMSTACSFSLAGRS